MFFQMKWKKKDGLVKNTSAAAVLHLLCGQIHCHPASYMSRKCASHLQSSLFVWKDVREKFQRHAVDCSSLASCWFVFVFSVFESSTFRQLCLKHRFLLCPVCVSFVSTTFCILSYTDWSFCPDVLTSYTVST